LSFIKALFLFLAHIFSIEMTSLNQRVANFPNGYVSQQIDEYRKLMGEISLHAALWIWIIQSLC
jgi:hypothetical protein